MSLLFSLHAPVSGMQLADSLVTRDGVARPEVTLHCNASVGRKVAHQRCNAGCTAFTGSSGLRASRKWLLQQRAQPPAGSHQHTLSSLGNSPTSPLRLTQCEGLVSPHEDALIMIMQFTHAAKSPQASICLVKEWCMDVRFPVQCAHLLVCGFLTSSST